MRHRIHFIQLFNAHQFDVVLESTTAAQYKTPLVHLMVVVTQIYRK